MLSQINIVSQNLWNKTLNYIFNSWFKAYCQENLSVYQKVLCNLLGISCSGLVLRNQDGRLKNGLFLFGYTRLLAEGSLFKLVLQVLGFSTFTGSTMCETTFEWYFNFTSDIFWITLIRFRFHISLIPILVFQTSWFIVHCWWKNIQIWSWTDIKIRCWYKLFKNNGFAILLPFNHMTIVCANPKKYTFITIWNNPKDLQWEWN